MSGTPWRIRRLAPADETAVLKLLEDASLPTTDLDATRLEYFLVADGETGVVGIAGLEAHSTVALLRSVVVADDSRGRGLGRALVRAAEDLARKAGIRELYLLTTTASAFFGSLGYRTTPRVSAPPAVAASAEFARLCPASAVCMHKALGPIASDGRSVDD